MHGYVVNSIAMFVIQFGVFMVKANRICARKGYHVNAL